MRLLGNISFQQEKRRSIFRPPVMNFISGNTVEVEYAPTREVVFLLGRQGVQNNGSPLFNITTSNTAK